MLKPPTSRYRHLSFPTVHIFEPFTLFCQFREKEEIWTFSHMLLEEVRYFPIGKPAVVVKLAFAIVSYYSRSVVASVVIIIVVVKIVIVVIIRYCKRKCKVKNDSNVVAGITCLTHMSMPSFLWDIGKRCRPNQTSQNTDIVPCLDISNQRVCS